MPRNIIVFVADGLRPGSINPIDTPTLYSVQQTGVNFTDSHALFPTFTTPNASAIVTGHYLGDTGDFSNTIYAGTPIPNANGSVTPFIENDPILADLNSIYSNANKADPDFSLNNFLTEESLLAYARANGYSAAAIGKLGPVAIADVGEVNRTGGTASPDVIPQTVIIDDSTFINTEANSLNPPVSTTTGSQIAEPLSQAIADRFASAGLYGQTVPGTTTVATTIGALRIQPSGNLTTAGTLNANTVQQQFFADVTTKAVLPQFVSDIASGASKGFAALYWSRDPDGTQHNNGDAFNAADPGNNSLTIGINGPTPKKAVANADANLKQLIDYLKATPDPANPGKTLYDNTDIFVTADHGFSTISKQAVGVTFDAAGNPTYTNTTSYASTLSFAGVHAGFLPPGFVAIDLAHDLGSTLYDPDTAATPLDANKNIAFKAVDPTLGQRPVNGNGVIGGSGTATNGVIDPNTQVVIAANGGSDLLYVPSNDPELVKKIVSLLAQKDYISGIFTDDKFGDVPGALKLSTIGLEGNASTPTPSIVISFKTFSTNPSNPNDPQAEVEVADTTLQQGQGMHGSFGRGDTFNNMAAIGPDFKSNYVDTAPVSNADVAPTLASILGWTLPSVGSLTGRVISEALVGGPAKAYATESTLVSTPVNGQSTILNVETVGKTPYFNVAGFAGGTDGLAPIAFSGIAAGDATSSDAILWTRAYDPVTKKGDNTHLTAQVSTDPNFAANLYTYDVPARTDGLDHDGTAKVDATGLTSGIKYYYRFVSDTGIVSPVGTFKTEPDANAKVAVRFGFSGDADGLMRPYASTANFGKLGLDFFGFLGDTIYETASTGSPAAADPVANPSQALVDYHRKYLENIQPVNPGGFSDLETLFSSQGNYTLLDNHELGNKQLINGGAPAALATTSGNGSSNPADDVNKTGTFINDTVAFKTLEQAYSDYQPIREQFVSAPNDPRSDGTQKLYNAEQWGKNVLYVNTDTRSYRDVRLKTAAGADDTGARADNPDRTLLGVTQLAWLKQTLLTAQQDGTVWKFVAISDPIDQIGAIGTGADGGKSWIGGYRAERNDLLKFIADNGIKNVVFLATDDHQNRINELTYLDNISDPTSVKVLPNALSIVDGPIGATGPDTITDHSFANVKSLADKLATTETAAGVNPVGLDPKFPGLKNVVREGDPNADTLRQPIDFYSPDTFNYTVFDVSPDGKTLNVNVQGINSVPVNTFQEPSASNPVRSILSFSLVAAPPTLQVSAATPTIAEASSTPGLFHVTADSLLSTPLTFNYSLGGTANNGADYGQLSGSATIAAGQSSVDIQVAPINDKLFEGNENVTLTLQNSTSYTIPDATKSASLTIIDDDKAPVATPPSPGLPPKNSAFGHVLVISIDGLHNSDLSVANLQSSLTNIKRLQNQGITYTNAFSAAPSDSFPGELNYITGANPGTTGVFYDKSYSRTLYAPGTTAAEIANGTALSGTGIEFAENADASWNNGKGGTLDGGQGFDVSQLPVDSNGNPVYPNQYLKVNTIFDVANAAGLRTAWSDKHPAAYTVLAGNAQDPTKFNFATGQVGSISDYSSLEINAATAIDPTKKGPLPTSLGALVDQSTGTPFSNTNPNITSNFFNDATKGNTALFKAPPTGFSANQFTSVATTSAFDDLRVKQILNEIDGLDHTGTNAAGTPAIFGLNLQAVSVGEKEPATLFNGGGIDANGNARPDLVSAVAHTDASIGLILDELKKKGLDSSTLVVLTAKHGQNPVQDPTVGLSSTFDSTTGQAGGDGGLTAFGALLARNGIEIASENGGDTSSLIFLKNKADVQKAVALLNAKNYSFDTAKDLISDPTGNTLFSTEDAAAQGTVLSGQAIINAGLGDPLTNDRTPDIVVPLNEGYFFGNATKKRSEHGGFTDADTHVALIAGSAGLSSSLQGATDTHKVSTTQIAPTILEALGLDPKALQGVQLDGTQDLGINPKAFLPTLRVDATTASTAEGSSMPGIFHVATSGLVATPLTFSYAIAGTATNGADYGQLSGTATIAAGQSAVDIKIAPIDDTLVEGTEGVALTLNTSTAYNTDPGQLSASVSILDNDTAPVINPGPTPLGTPGNDLLIAQPGTNFTGQGNLLFTGAGDDTVDLSISPAASNNRVYLGSGNDIVYVSQGDQVFGEAGNDTFDATDGRGGNRMSGGAGDDLFFLGAGDYALGGDGNDKFFAGTGGGNVISGGAGADQFWLFNAELPTKSNTVLDFQVGTDVIGINDGGQLGFNDLTRTGDTIAIGGTVIATLTGINTTNLTASSFLFV